MSDPNSSEPNKPDALSPEALAIMAKARRSFLISMGILLLGFMAIGFALVYRVMRDSPPIEMVAGVTLPQGAEVVSAMVADGAINITFLADGVMHLRLYDQSTGEITRDLVLQNEP
ncbi:hypothetical protein PSQ90_11640 [Devosia rhodophyticola]|uniref:Fimbrial protein n=1 Tax=Devosia rhodophyticola TaxID=3026423 RepID=A0ABY7YUG9_9HYPH|nr:hypothetical protein [Devosia rhodophyticola]WDR04949.1 hypothetical protein PSQ90_11640 [Devosia rhodophyticola]